VPHPDRRTSRRPTPIPVPDFDADPRARARTTDPHRATTATRPPSRPSRRSATLYRPSGRPASTNNRPHPQLDHPRRKRRPSRPLSNVLPFSGSRRTDAASVPRPRGGAGAARAVAARARLRARHVGGCPLQRRVGQGGDQFQVHLQSPLTSAPGPTPTPRLRSSFFDDRPLAPGSIGVPHPDRRTTRRADADPGRGLRRRPSREGSHDRPASRHHREATTVAAELSPRHVRPPSSVLTFNQQPNPPSTGSPSTKASFEPSAVQRSAVQRQAPTAAQAYHGPRGAAGAARGVAATQPSSGPRAPGRCNGLLDRASRIPRFIPNAPSRVPSVRLRNSGDLGRHSERSARPNVHPPAHTAPDERVGRLRSPSAPALSPPANENSSRPT
jgi:hypothetical protein